MLCPNLVIPTSLFSTVIPDIVRGDSHVYHTLKLNTDTIDKKIHFCKDRVNVVTPSNWKRILKKNVTVMIPITSSQIHHKQIEKYGHDRILELRFTGAVPMPNGDIQLTFDTMRGTELHKRLPCVACRVYGLDEYPYKLCVHLSHEEKKRENMKLKMIMWRECVYRETKDILNEEIAKKNVSKIQAEYLRSKVRRLIARTREEHIDRDENPVE